MHGYARQHHNELRWKGGENYNLNAHKTKQKKNVDERNERKKEEKNWVSSAGQMRVLRAVTIDLNIDCD